MSEQDKLPKDLTFEDTPQVHSERHRRMRELLKGAPKESMKELLEDQPATPVDDILALIRNRQKERGTEKQKLKNIENDKRELFEEKYSKEEINDLINGILDYQLSQILPASVFVGIRLRRKYEDEVAQLICENEPYVLMRAILDELIKSFGRPRK